MRYVEEHSNCNQMIVIKISTFLSAIKFSFETSVKLHKSEQLLLSNYIFHYYSNLTFILKYLGKKPYTVNSNKKKYMS